MTNQMEFNSFAAKSSLNHNKALVTTAWCQGRYTVPSKYEPTIVALLNSDSFIFREPVADSDIKKKTIHVTWSRKR